MALVYANVYKRHHCERLWQFENLLLLRPCVKANSHRMRFDAYACVARQKRMRMRNLRRGIRILVWIGEKPCVWRLRTRQTQTQWYASRVQHRRTFYACLCVNRAIFSRHDTCKLLCDTSLALTRLSPTGRYTYIHILVITVSWGGGSIIVSWQWG